MSACWGPLMAGGVAWTPLPMLALPEALPKPRPGPWSQQVQPEKVDGGRVLGVAELRGIILLMGGSCEGWALGLATAAAWAGLAGCGRCDPRTGRHPTGRRSCWLLRWRLGGRARLRGWTGAARGLWRPGGYAGLEALGLPATVCALMQRHVLWHGLKGHYAFRQAGALRRCGSAR